MEHSVLCLLATILGTVLQGPVGLHWERHRHTCPPPLLEAPVAQNLCLLAAYNVPGVAQTVLALKSSGINKKPISVAEGLQGSAWAGGSPRPTRPGTWLRRHKAPNLGWHYLGAPGSSPQAELYPLPFISRQPGGDDGVNHISVTPYLRTLMPSHPFTVKSQIPGPAELPTPLPQDSQPNLCFS